MIYAVIGIVVIIALFLIFRDDHDYSYNKREKGPRVEAPKPQSIPKPESTPKLSPKSEPLSEPYLEIPEDEEEEIELDRSTARLIAEIKVIIPSSRDFVEEEIEEEL